MEPIYNPKKKLFRVENLPNGSQVRYYLDPWTRQVTVIAVQTNQKRGK